MTILLAGTCATPFLATTFVTEEGEEEQEEEEEEETISKGGNGT